MRLVFLGTGPFAVPTFRSLLDSRHEVAALVTRPTPPVKSRERAPHNPMRETAEARVVAVYAPASINSAEGRRLIESLRPELLVVCDFGQILSAEILGLAPLGGINLHASLLPRYRGAAPIQWALLNCESETGVSVIHMTPRMDAGPILAVRQTLISSDETHPELEHRLAQLGIEPVHVAIELLAGWDQVSPLGTPQDATLATKAPRLKKEHGEIDWSRSAEQIRNQVRALKPWPGTFTFWSRPLHEPLRIVVDRVSILGLGIRAAALVETTAPQHLPGEIVVSDRQQLIVATGDGGLSLLSVQPAGKRVMPIADFLHGYHLREGDRLG